MKLIYADKEFAINQGETIKEVLKEEIEKRDKEIITCRFNNEIKSLNYIPKESGKVELLDYANTEGKRVYVRGIMYVMAMSINEIFPKALLTINYQLDNSMFCSFDNMEITEKVLEEIKEKMIKIVDSDLPITKVKMTPEEAKEFYEKEKNLRGILQISHETKEVVSLYYCKDYYNYFYGVMPISTGYMKVFDIVKYKNGFLLRYPSKENPQKLKKFNDNKKLAMTFQEYEDINKVLKLDTIYRLNKSIEKDEGKETILLAESLHEKKISDIADVISNNKKVKMVLIAGPSSSRKNNICKKTWNAIEIKWNDS